MSVVVQVVQPSGILDKPNAEPFRREIISHVEAGTQIILVDLQEVTFMDSSGLEGLILGLKKVREVEGKICLCSMNEQIRILFELTNLEQFFEIYPDRAAFEETLAK